LLTNLQVKPVNSDMAQNTVTAITIKINQELAIHTLLINKTKKQILTMKTFQKSLILKK